MSEKVRARAGRGGGRCAVVLQGRRRREGRRKGPRRAALLACTTPRAHAWQTHHQWQVTRQTLSHCQCITTILDTFTSQPFKPQGSAPSCAKPKLTEEAVALGRGGHNREVCHLQRRPRLCLALHQHLPKGKANRASKRVEGSMKQARKLS